MMVRRIKYGTYRRERADGYIDVWDPRHPIARADGYVFEHRRMAWDAGLLTDPADEVHHRNEDRGDNRLENFEVMTTAGHAAHHAATRGISNQYGSWAPAAERSPRHGTANEYSRWGCRCRACTDAAVAKARYYRERAKAASS